MGNEHARAPASARLRVCECACTCICACACVRTLCVRVSARVCVCVGVRVRVRACAHRRRLGGRRRRRERKARVHPRALACSRVLLHLHVQAMVRRSFIKPRPFGKASQATPQGRAEPGTHSAPRRWSCVLDFESVVWTPPQAIGATAPARPPIRRRAGTRRSRPSRRGFAVTLITTTVREQHHRSHQEFYH